MEGRGWLWQTSPCGILDQTLITCIAAKWNDGPEGFRPGCVCSAPTCENRSTLYILVEFPLQTKSECFEIMNLYRSRLRTILAFTEILYYRRDWDRLQVRYQSLIKTEYCLAEKTSSTTNSCTLHTSSSLSQAVVCIFGIHRKFDLKSRSQQKKKLFFLASGWILTGKRGALQTTQLWMRSFPHEHNHILIFESTSVF